MRGGIVLGLEDCRLADDPDRQERAGVRRRHGRRRAARSCRRGNRRRRGGRGRRAARPASVPDRGRTRSASTISTARCERTVMTEPIRVGVLGARGRMGQQVCRAVDAAPDLDLVAMVDAGDWLFSVADAGAQVLVDFTHPGRGHGQHPLRRRPRHPRCRRHHRIHPGAAGHGARMARRRARAGRGYRAELGYRCGAVDEVRPARRARSTTRPRWSSCTIRTRWTRRAAPPCTPPS